MRPVSHAARLMRCRMPLVLAAALASATPAVAQLPNPHGPEFQINSFTTGTQTEPAAAMDSAGNFVVVWESYGSSGSDTSGGSVQGQRYAANGSPLGPEFQVNSYTTGGQRCPGVAKDSAGNFVVVWRSNGSSGSDTRATSIQGQRYAASGSPLGSQFQINSYTTGNQSAPSAAMDSAGSFVVLWQSFGSRGSDASATSIQGQRFAASGSPVGPEFQVNSYTTSYQGTPSAAMDGAGNFVVAWMSEGSGGSDTSYYSIQGQRYAANGSPVGSQFQVNSYTTDYQQGPAATMDSAGDFVVAWGSDGSSGSDTSGSSVQGQLYDALFRDGFESNDLSRWSSNQP